MLILIASVAALLVRSLKNACVLSDFALLMLSPAKLPGRIVDV